MKPNILFALAMAAAAAGSRFMQGGRTLADMGLGSNGGGVPSSRNGGRRGAGMAAKRAAVKARNVKRHRVACRG
jgi:hypothetical protein